MRILIVYRHYWPDTTSYARLLRSIAERLAADGHEVTVLTAQPSYNDIRQQSRARRETVGGVRILRLPLPPERKSFLPSRLLASGLFLAGSLLYGLLSRGHHLVMTVSTPPAVMGFTVWLLTRLRRARYLYHCQDLMPEAAALGGKFKKGLLYGLMMALEKTTHRGAEAVVVLSSDMAETVRGRGLDGNNVHVLNNFMLELYEEEVSVPESLAPSPDCYRVLFAGNHGVFQGLDHVIEAARRLRDYPDIRLQLVGEGLAKPRLMEQAGDMLGRTVFFHPYVSVEVIQKVMEQSQLGLITLEPDLYRVAYPSKTMTLLKAGLPLVVVVEPESELSSLVTREQVGRVCPPRDPKALAAAILEAYRERESLPTQRERCRAVAERYFGLQPNLDRWSRLMDELARSTDRS